MEKIEFEEPVLIVLERIDIRKLQKNKPIAKSFELTHQPTGQVIGISFVIAKGKVIREMRKLE